VHRFKGLAVRRNVARQFGFASLREPGSTVDPWSVLFSRAHDQHGAEGNDLVPYWVYDEGESPVRVQRCVPIIPLSKEEDQYKRLKEDLVLYRLAFGQPRQEDLIAWLSSATGHQGRPGHPGILAAGPAASCRGYLHRRITGGREETDVLVRPVAGSKLLARVVWRRLRCDYWVPTFVTGLRQRLWAPHHGGSWSRMFFCCKSTFKPGCRVHAPLRYLPAGSTQSKV